MNDQVNQAIERSRTVAVQGDTRQLFLTAHNDCVTLAHEVARLQAIVDEPGGAAMPTASCTGKEVVDDPVNHPPHYTHGNIECLDVIEDWDLGFHLGNVLKYICRAGHKGDTKQDILKAKQYLNRYIDFRFGVTPASETKEPHPENRCGMCGCLNVVWHTDDVLWNNIAGDISILCLVCFCQLAEKAGVRPTSWKLSMPGDELAQLLHDFK